MSKSKLSREFYVQMPNEQSRAPEKEAGNREFRDRDDYCEALHRFKHVLERESSPVDDEKRCFEKPIQNKAEQGKLASRYSRRTSAVKVIALCSSKLNQPCLPTRTQRDYGYEN